MSPVSSEDPTGGESAQRPPVRMLRRIVHAMTIALAGLVAVAVVALVTIGPTFGLVGLWRWSDALASEPAPPVVLFDGDAMTADDPPPSGGAVSAVLDLRRTASGISLRERQLALSDTLDQLRVDAASASCALVRLDDTVVVGVKPDIGFAIADSAMLITAAVALEVLGPDHRFVTELRVAEEPDDGVIVGDLFVVGSGDPMLVSDDLAVAAALGGEQLPAVLLDADGPVTAVSDLVGALAEQQIVSIGGDVIGVGDRFDDEYVVTTWASTGRVPPHGGLLINRGLLFGSTYGLNPVQSAANEVLRQLRANDVRVAGRSRALTDSDALVDDVMLASVESAPLAEIIPALLTDRDAIGFEMLLKEIGAEASQSGSTNGGRAAVADALFAWDVNQDEINFPDGSGRTPGAMMTCSALLAATERIAMALESTSASQPSIEEFAVGAERIVVISGELDDGSSVHGVIVGDPDLGVVGSLFSSDGLDASALGPLQRR